MSFWCNAFFYMLFAFFLTYSALVDLDGTQIENFTLYVTNQLLVGTGGTCGTGNDFLDISDADSFWTWAIDDLATNAFLDSSMTGYLQLVGDSYIRQFRVVSSTCTSPYATDVTCYDTLGEKSNWQTGDTFLSTTWSDTVGIRIWETASTSLPRGGYYSDLPITNSSAMKAVFERLKNESWIDEATRAVDIHVNIYSANTNILIIANFIVEFLAEGKTQSDGLMYKLNDYELTNTITLWSRIVVIFFAVGYIWLEIKQLVTSCYWIKTDDSDEPILRPYYFNDLWNYMDFVLFMGILLITVYTTYFCGTLDPYTVTLEDGMSFWKKQYIRAAVEVFFVAIIFVRILFFLRVSIRTGPLIVSVLKMFQDVFNFLFIALVLIATMTVIYTALFSDDGESYVTFPLSLFSFTQNVFGQMEFLSSDSGGQSMSVITGNVIFVIFLFLMLILLINLLIAMMGNTYDSVREEAISIWGSQFAELVIQFEALYVTIPSPIIIPIDLFLLVFYLFLYFGKGCIFLLKKLGFVIEFNHTYNFLDPLKTISKTFVCYVPYRHRNRAVHALLAYYKAEKKKAEKDDEIDAQAEYEAKELDVDDYSDSEEEVSVSLDVVDEADRKSVV